MREAALRRDPSTRRGMIQKGDTGERCPSWKGGRWIHGPSGYVIITTDEGPRYEHRVVAERMLRRRLFPAEEVHHIDHNRSNNATINLMVFHNHRDHLLYERLTMPTSTVAKP